MNFTFLIIYKTGYILHIEIIKYLVIAAYLMQSYKAKELIRKYKIECVDVQNGSGRMSFNWGSLAATF